ncbi:hypothetical protein HF521_002847 [Silurus meridionalis]|uniref:OCA domain-containing protein n=1 Tax=Silurus meridionalis TaxID=175797 RepID=A0A8T0B3U8_SILME|nr:hypothetical protein HF521_002847 [Silurus meridionalis]
MTDFFFVCCRGKLNMVRSREGNTGSKMIPVNCEGNEKEYGACSYNHSPLPGDLAFNMNETNSPTSALTGLDEEVCNLAVITEQESFSPKGKNALRTKADRTYLGVRVRMPVKDMLRDIRIAKGMDPIEMQMKENKGSKGDKKRVNISGGRRNRLVGKCQTKSLEDEFAIIVEVLEEDLKTSTSIQPSNHLDLENKFWAKTISQQGLQDASPPIPICNTATKKFPLPPGIYGSAHSHAASLFTDTKIKNSSGESDYFIHRRQHEMTCSPGDSKVQVPSPDENYFAPRWTSGIHHTK